MSRWDQSENHLRAQHHIAQPWCHQPGQDTQTHDSRHQTVNVWNSSAENLSKFYFITQCVWVDKLRCIVDCTVFTDKIFLCIFCNIYVFKCIFIYIYNFYTNSFTVLDYTESV